MTSRCACPLLRRRLGDALEAVRWIDALRECVVFFFFFFFFKKQEVLKNAGDGEPLVIDEIMPKGRGAVIVTERAEASA